MFTLGHSLGDVQWAVGTTELELTGEVRFGDSILRGVQTGVTGEMKAERDWCHLSAPGGGGGRSGVKEKDVRPAWKQLHRGDRTLMSMSTMYESHSDEFPHIKAKCRTKQCVRCWRYKDEQH